MSLREKLSRIYGETATAGSVRGKLEGAARQQSENSISNFLGGHWITSPDGRVFCVDRHWPLDHPHGSLALSEIYNVPSETVRLLAGPEDLVDFHPDETLFLDTETTGLAGGAGTWVFLVGLGFFSGDRFQVRQLFLPSFDRERLFLEELCRAVGNDRFRYLVSFNGKGYDLNLLENRFILQRLENPFEGMAHLDLLHCSRLLWKGSFRDCALQTLEANLLGFRRFEDIPSYLIPRVYFDYVRFGNYRLFDQVFEHNRLDLLTLVNLITLASRAALRPGPSLCTTYGAVSRMYELRGNLPGAEELLERALRSRQQTNEDLFRLATIKKRLGKFEEALPLFLQLTASRFPNNPAFEEAAKILEHEMRDFREALRVVDLALELGRTPELEYRKHRLACRIEGKRWY